MSEGPSIKGAAIAKLVDDAQRLLEASEERRERIEAGLSAGALALLEEKLAIGRWYPIEHYRELTEMLWREEGGGRIEYLHERGAAVMKRLMEVGIYQQLNFLSRSSGEWSPRRTREQILSSTRLIGSLMGAILNFTTSQWHFDAKNPNHLLHEISGASALPEVFRFVQEGSETYLVRLARPNASPVTSQRVAPDRIILTLDYTGLFDSEPRGTE